MIKRRVTLLTGSICSALALTGFTYWLYLQHHIVSPVPKSILQNIRFTVYYPVQKELPTGFTLDLNSFNQPIQSGVNYTVSYGQEQKLVFSLQPKPSANNLEAFEASYIPLHNTYQTPYGQALIGAYDTKSGTETLVSLSINNSNTWIIITAPYDVNQAQLKQVLSSLKP